MKSFKPRIGCALALALAASCMGDGTLMAHGGQGGGSNVDDKAQRAMERAARDAARAQEQADRAATRYAEEKAKIMDRAAKDPTKAQQDIVKLEADRAKEEAKIAADAAKDLADLQEELRKAQEDAARDAERAAEDVAEHGSSAEMRDLAREENPEFDRRGFPVRRGEVVTLNMAPAALNEAQNQGFRIIADETLAELGGRVVRLGAPEGMDAQDALDRVRKIDPSGVFDYVHYYGLQYRPSGTISGSSPATLGENLPRKKDKLTIGMIDTGIVNHPALKGSSITAKDFAPVGGGVPVDHGTAVASILVSEGSDTLYVANIFRGHGATPFTSADAIVRALEWMVHNRVPVVNISLAGPRNAVLDALVERTAGRGIAIVAAAGNGGPTAPPAYPAALRPVVAVTAVDKGMRVYRYANQGHYITVAARGVAEPAAQSMGGIGQFSGTSFATPHIAAWMARCMKSEPSTGCTAQLRRNAHDLGEPGYDPVYGYGYVR